jgi:hypothetical protein
MTTDNTNYTDDINLENELDMQIAPAQEWETQEDIAYEDQPDELAADCPLTPPPPGTDILEIARENWNIRGANAGPVCDQCEQDRTGYGGRICLACDTQPEECRCGCNGVWEDHELWQRIRRDLSQMFVHIEVPPPSPVTQG